MNEYELSQIAQKMFNMMHDQKAIIQCVYCHAHNAIGNPTCVQCGGPFPTEPTYIEKERYPYSYVPPSPYFQEEPDIPDSPYFMGNGVSLNDYYYDGGVSLRSGDGVGNAVWISPWDDKPLIPPLPEPKPPSNYTRWIETGTIEEKKGIVERAKEWIQSI